MHTLHILPKDLHICKLTAVNVVDVEERGKDAEREYGMEGGRRGVVFSYMIVPLNLITSMLPLFTLHNVLKSLVYCQL